MSPLPVTDPVEVRLESVTVECGRRRKNPLRALQGLDLDLRPGEVTVLLGPNGSGTTRHVLGLEPLASAGTEEVAKPRSSPHSRVVSRNRWTSGEGSHE